MDVRGNDFSAHQALQRSQKIGVNYSAKADNLNYTLTLQRVLSIIEATANAGMDRYVIYNVPGYVLDGTSTNPPLLAKQIKKRLVELGYMVNRTKGVLHIDWDFELVEKEKQLEQKRRAAEAKARKEQKRKMKTLRDQAAFGTRSRGDLQSLVPIFRPPRVDLNDDDINSNSKTRPSPSKHKSSFSVTKTKLRHKSK